MLPHNDNSMVRSFSWSTTQVDRPAVLKENCLTNTLPHPLLGISTPVSIIAPSSYKGAANHDTIIGHTMPVNSSGVRIALAEVVLHTGYRGTAQLPAKRVVATHHGLGSLLQGSDKTGLNVRTISRLLCWQGQGKSTMVLQSQKAPASI
eukprot:3093711-Amphidinium_carterae.1